MINPLSGGLGAPAATSTVKGAPQPSMRAVPAPPSVASEFEAFAKSYDVHSLTPKEIDEMAESMPINKPGDMRVKMMLLTRGEQWMRHAAKIAEEVTGEDQSEALAAKLSTKTDLVEDFTAAIDMAKRHGDPTAELERTLSYLQQMDARRYLPEGGVVV